MNTSVLTRRPAAVLAASALGLSLVLAGCGNSSTNSNGAASGSSKSNGGGYTVASGKTCSASQWVGNRKSKVLHAPHTGNMPSPKNQVCFASEAAGQRAGYHLSGH